MKFVYIDDDSNIPEKWDILFRCYDTIPVNTDITNDYIAQIWSNINFGNETMEDGQKFVDGNIQGKAQFLQGIKSIWHKLLRFLNKFENDDLVVVFLNEFLDNPGMEYKDWMEKMYLSSLKDCSYNTTVEEKRIELNWNLALGDYYPSGKFKGSRIDGRTSEIPYLRWLRDKTTAKLSQELLNKL